MDIFEFRAAEIVRILDIEAEVEALIGLALQQQAVEAGAAVDAQEGVVDDRDGVVASTGVDHIGAASAAHLIVALEAVDHIGQGRAGQHVVVDCADLGGDAQEVSSIEGILRAGVGIAAGTTGGVGGGDVVKGDAGGGGNQEVAQAIAIELNIAINRIASQRSRRLIDINPALQRIEQAGARLTGCEVGDGEGIR